MSLFLLFLKSYGAYNTFILSHSSVAMYWGSSYFPIAGKLSGKTSLGYRAENRTRAYQLSYIYLQFPLHNQFQAYCLSDSHRSPC